MTRHYKMASNEPEKVAQRSQPLGADEIHIWIVSSGETASNLPSLTRYLSHTEIERANRYHHQSDRIRFVLRRGMLRILLGAYLHLDPFLLRFTYNEYGKPALANQRPQDQIIFSLSHSPGIVMYAFMRRGAVGIDVEGIRFFPGYRDLMARYFSAEAYSSLAAVPANEALECFYRYWTRMEAVAKASGMGLSRFQRGTWPAPEPAQMPFNRSQDFDAREAGRWTIVEIRPLPGYVAAVASSESGSQARSYHLTGSENGFTLERIGDLAGSAG